MQRAQHAAPLRSNIIAHCGFTQPLRAGATHASPWARHALPLRPHLFHLFLPIEGQTIQRHCGRQIIPGKHIIAPGGKTVEGHDNTFPAWFVRVIKGGELAFKGAEKKLADSFFA
ncbi:hypothetical protein GFER_16140 [Geoalkalibacter ferrihydriticus DSM 17813]|uniref:Uncharacterized protein n=1 Tax=Geoalkalibacter ferrihydriticus DSM 17813 TaxID=1121915 RepID=A0A0C2DQ26_9BACT|nr:hypothetical protein GFER_16140 [Geoalkalibacter ferrihydriticus DSM 17813]